MTGIRTWPKGFWVVCATCVAVGLLALTAASGQTNAPTSASPPATPSFEEDAAWSQHVVQSYQQLQQQQQSMLRAIEQARQDAAATARAIEAARQEAEAAAKRNAEAVDARLNRIEQTVTAQRQREIETMQSSHRFTLIIVGIFAGAGFFGMLFFALLLLRSMNRRAEAVLAQGFGQPLGAGFAPAALGAGGDTHLVRASPAEQSGARLLSTIQRLEKRIQELEDTAAPPPAEPRQAATAVPEPKPATPPAPPETAPAAEPDASASAARAHAERAARIALLLGKGQALLNLQQADTALGCFDEVIALDKTNAEAFVKKGAALERLGRLDEAIDCYDRAIALDNSMTMAYLSKGGVFNRLERYAEALQCYEQALRAQQKTGVS